MPENKHTTPELAGLFYQSLGNLFYAIASVDGIVRPEELQVLDTHLKKDWCRAGLFDEAMENNADFLIKSTFNRLLLAQTEADTAFKTFRDFALQHREMFDENVNQKIWKTADALAASFADKNKSEVILLAKLKLLLLELP